jgi:photosystem II stability/assembly factor-like uncharacterized protein
MMMYNRSAVIFFMISILVLTISGGYISSVCAQEISPDFYKQLQYRFIGPQGNRSIAVIGIPGDPNIYYVGAASGGIFKTLDGGTSWEPIFDDQPVSSIGSLAIAPSDHNIIWAGTGETFIRSNVSIGNGIYKSTDKGKTWRHMGLEKTGRIGRIIIDPRDPDIVLAAAMGHCYGPQQERGVYRTSDGGKTWERVLFVDENTGCSDIAIDPDNPRILFAGMWQLDIKTWGRVSGGPGSGLYRSEDGGATWKQLTGHGLPEPPMGKIGITIAPDNPNRIYALIESDEGVLWRSDDGGDNWELVNRDHLLTMRPAYYSRCAVSPDNHNEVYFLAPRFHKTLDGGHTCKRAYIKGGDNHDMWIDPTNANRMIVGNDKLVAISVNRGKTWQGAILPIAQMYHVAVDNQIPYYVYGNRQDGPSFRGPSNSLTEEQITSSLWRIHGGESGFTYPDPVDNSIIWSTYFGGAVRRLDLKTGQDRSVGPWPDSCIGSGAAPLKYRFQWTFPIAISPHDHNKLYAGSQYVHQTTDGGQSWKVISPDLSTNDKSKQQSSGGITPDNVCVEYGCCLFAIAESPVKEGVIWAGTNDGLLWITQDGGAKWTNVTKNIPDLPPWGTISNIESSRYDAGTCYITVDFHQVDNRDPYVYKTNNYGKSWRFISADIPKSPLSYAHCVREDPVRKGLLYLGTENALYLSFNDGENWLPLQNNLPHAPVHWLVVQEHFNDLVVSTYGRGFYILDDITPLQQLTAEILKSKFYLFAPRPAYRFRMVASRISDPDDQCIGQNPPYGASINYYLKSKPEGEVKIVIMDKGGQVVKNIEGTKNVGINRVWWDLRYESAKETKLRTSPIGAPHIKVGAKGWRSIVTWDSGITPLAAPGTYTVKLSVNGQELTQELVVKKDPHSAASVSDVQTQFKMLLQIRDNMNTLIDMINQAELIRKQLYDLQELLSHEEKNKPVISAIQDLDEKIIAVEENFFQMRLTGASQDVLRWPMKLLAKLGSLAFDIEMSDFPPTDQQVEVYEMYKEQLKAYEQQFQEILDKELPAFNQMLQEKNVPHIIVVQ